MPKPIRMRRRTWGAAWAVLCAAGLAATLELNASSAPEEPPEKPVTAECARIIADVERQLATARADGEGDDVLAFSRVRTGTEDDCGDALRDHFRSHQ
ncbi:hypothetical protein [Streptomyces longispororuber]|uniref:hypothetical protein n=1 Tax=Streptomyces longispororuber TaxID=68230 RepID=UPI00210E9649|nr:hypothetical protein [Streptomyces longispororuber]MCQ4211333.1 hypothetical protein [Streptomyces longispororuber]